PFAFHAGNLALLDQHQVLDANAVFAGLVVAGLVREDHPGHQLLIGPRLPAARLGDALRPFVNREEAADTVARAVRVVDARRPQELPRQRVELRADGALRERLHRESDMALEHAGEAILLLGRGFSQTVGGSDPYRAGDVGRAVGILAARVDQIDAARLDLQVAVLVHAVMRDRGMGPGGGDRVER